MANTIMSAKNSFQDGLIMDFSPDNTQATCLTSALNATLLTFNGNEMSLQNDMGNGRVETARLPEGYIPVGTCEFGDIIYIVSYNPITNKSQIGCFPSPERNISSEELYDKGSDGYQNLSYLDFQETKGGVITGRLTNTSVKKVLIDSKKLNPGDKYIIYTNPTSLTNNKECLSDFGASHNSLPKNVKLHVVSIEDSGKITYLDTTTKWYNIEGDQYYISSQKIGNTDNGDLDSYRNMLQSNWSIFSSKVSGKLAILAELEMIDTFSCSYDLEFIGFGTSIKDSYMQIRCKQYKVFLCPEYTSKSESINPEYLCITKAEFNSKSKLNDINDDNIKNYIDQWVYFYSENVNKTSTTYYHKATSSIQKSEQHGWVYADIEDVPISGGTFKKLLIGTVEIPYQQRRNSNEEWQEIKSNSFIYTLPRTFQESLEYLYVRRKIAPKRLSQAFSASDKQKILR